MDGPVMDGPRIRPTAMAHGGGCGCKLAPAVLQDILRIMPVPIPCAGLLVGTETSDDAAVYRLNESQAIVATTDFFTPIVDDPFEFGRIAATNALCDVYAMGGTPLFALALVGMPIASIPIETAQDIMAGAASVCAAGAAALAEAVYVTGASGRNWKSYGGAVRWPESEHQWRRELLCDPQNSGGLLVAVAPEDAEASSTSAARPASRRPR